MQHLNKIKSFRSIGQVKEFYFPISTAQEREEEFMKTATPAEIGKHMAKKTIEKLKSQCQLHNTEF